MWVRRSSIRPVPEYARIPRTTLELIRNNLVNEGDDAQDRLDDALDDFEIKQPVIAEQISEVLDRLKGEATTALGYFLSLAIWMAFRDGHSGKMRAVSEDELNSTTELFALDENLREDEVSESLETDDVIRMEQPALVDFIHEHIEATLDLEAAEVDANELQSVYRAILIEVLALSYSVVTPAGYPMGRSEAQA